MYKITPENTLIFTDYCKNYKLVYGENPNRHKVYIHNEWFHAHKLRKTININNIEDENIKNRSLRRLTTFTVGRIGRRTSQQQHFYPYF